MNYKDIAIRALKTFIQAFIPVVATAFATADITDLSNIKAIAYSALISGVAAGISAVWNVILGIHDIKAEKELAEDDAPQGDAPQDEDEPIG